MVGIQYITTEEKKQIFDRLTEMGSKMDTFIEEALGQINKSVEKINDFNARLFKIEKEVFNDGK